jgi:outer membrane receptor protein involved in Fe transport
MQMQVRIRTLVGAFALAAAVNGGAACAKDAVEAAAAPGNAASPEAARGAADAGQPDPSTPASSGSPAPDPANGAADVPPANDIAPPSAIRVEAQPSPKSDPDAVALGDIVVTATKREKSRRDIPASIDAIDGKSLEARGVLSVNEVLEQTPGVTTNSVRPGDQRIIMRGISTSASPISTVPYPVGIFIGDTALNEPYAASITPDLSAFDLAAVEILKGPQGTLFGGAALSGVLRYRLNDPNPYRWEARYFGQGSFPDEGSVAFTQGAVLNVPLLGDDGDLGLRLAYVRRRYPGVTDDLRPEQAAEDVNEGEGEQFRAALLWRPDDELQLKLTYLDQDYDAPNDLIIADNAGGPRATRGSLIPWPNSHRFGLYNLEMQYDWDDVRLISSSSRTEKKRFNIVDVYGGLLGTPPDGMPDAVAIPFVTEQASRSFQQELRLQSNGGESLEWLVGAYYLHSPIHYFLELNVQALHDLGPLANQAQQTLLSVADALGLGAIASQLLSQIVPGSDNLACELSLLCAQTDAKAREKALFFDLTWNPWRPLELSAGARLYETTVAGGFTGQGVGARLVNNGMSPADFTTTITERGVNPKLSAKYRFSKDHSIYALANKGFRFGGIQNIPADPVQNVPGTYKSDSIWNYELGLRTRWFERHLEFDVTGYHIDYKDPLVVLKNAEQINYYDNVGGARSNGVEASLRWLTPIPGVVLSATGGTVDARTTKDFQAGNTTVPAGKPLPGSAEYQYGADLAVFGSPAWPVNVAGLIGYSYVGKTYNDITTDDTVNDYGTVNLGLNLSMPYVKGRPALAVNVSNLTDQTAPVSLMSIATGGEFYLLNAPRTITARFSLEFD